MNSNALPPATIEPNKPAPVGRTQVGLRTLLMLTACIAAWMVVFLNRQQLSSVELRIKAARPLAHELIVDDPSLVAIVKQDEHMYDEQVWHVYVPTESLSVYLSTRNIPTSDSGPDNALKAAAHSSPLSTGRHVIALTSVLEGDTWVTRVDIDGKVKLVAKENKLWDPQHGSSGGGNFSTQSELVPTAPIVLFKRRLMMQTSGTTSQVPKNPSEGIMLWIE